MIDQYNGDENQHDDPGYNIDHIDLPYWKRVIDKATTRIKDLADGYDYTNKTCQTGLEYESTLAQLVFAACRVPRAKRDTLEDYCSCGPLVAKLARYLPTAKKPKQALAKYFKQAAWDWVDERRRELTYDSNRETPIPPTSDSGRQLAKKRLQDLLGIPESERTPDWTMDKWAEQVRGGKERMLINLEDNDTDYFPGQTNWGGLLVAFAKKTSPN